MSLTDNNQPNKACQNGDCASIAKEAVCKCGNLSKDLSLATKQSVCKNDNNEKSPQNPICCEDCGKNLQNSGNSDDYNKNPKRLLILISGGGSNMQAVFDAIDDGSLNAAVIAVVASNHEAGGLGRAKSRGIPSYVCALKDYSSREERDKAILEIANKNGVDYILTLGYLGICSPLLVEAYPKRIINIHPALLPKFGGKGFFGLNVHKAVIESGEKVSGATVHYADEGTDTGEIIMSRKVEVKDGDTPEALQKRVLAAEHILIVDALKKLIDSE